MTNKTFATTDLFLHMVAASESQAPSHQLTEKNAREGHRKPLDGRTNSRPFRSKSQTDFATAKMSAEITAKVFVTRKPAWTKIVVDT